MNHKGGENLLSGTSGCTHKGAQGRGKRNVLGSEMVFFFFTESLLHTAVHLRLQPSVLTWFSASNVCVKNSTEHVCEAVVSGKRGQVKTTDVFSPSSR